MGRQPPARPLARTAPPECRANSTKSPLAPWSDRTERSAAPRSSQPSASHASLLLVHRFVSPQAPTKPWASRRAALGCPHLGKSLSTNAPALWAPRVPNAAKSTGLALGLFLGHLVAD